MVRASRAGRLGVALAGAALSCVELRSSPWDAGDASVVDAGVLASALRLFSTQDEMTAALRSGAIDAAVLPISEVVVMSRDVKGLVAGVTVGPRGKIAWAVRKQDPALRAALDEYLGNVRRGSSWSRLIVKYFGDQALQVLGKDR